MLHITLGARKTIQDDSWGRTHVGFWEGMTDDEMYRINRGTWVLGIRADQERYALFSYAGIVRQAIEIHEVVPVTDGRRAIEGRVLTNGEPVYDSYVGEASPVQGARNPITYISDPTFDDRSCGCGLKSTRLCWVSGTDHRAIYERVARIGTVRDFITWFDQHYSGS